MTAPGWYNARCVERVYLAAGGVCGAPVRAVLGFRRGGPARVGLDPYVYCCLLYATKTEPHHHQGRAVWIDPRIRDLGRAEERYRDRPGAERVVPARPAPRLEAVQRRIA